MAPDSITTGVLIRWGIETAFDELKNKLALENFTGIRPVLIEQDIYASIYLCNCLEDIIQEIEPECLNRTKGRHKHPMKVNRNIAIGVFKEQLLHLILDNDPIKQTTLYEEMCQEVERNLIPIRPDRNFPRTRSRFAIKHPNNRNDIKDPIRALEIYRNKDLVEKAFGNLKERLNLRRTLVSSEQSLDGKLFVEFVALIYLSYIKKKMQDADLFKKYTLQGLLDEFDVIECFEQKGKDRRWGEMTKKQTNLFSMMGVALPSLHDSGI